MATIIMSSFDVMDAAKKVITRIEAKRKKTDEVTINTAMSKARGFSFRRGFYKFNREEAIKWINDQGMWDSWGWSIYAWGDLDHANKLFNLAKHGDPVTLNQDDIAVLFKD